MCRGAHPWATRNNKICMRGDEGGAPTFIKINYERACMNKKKLKNTEWKILIYVTLLLIMGLIALYSASTSNEIAEFKKQIMWIAIGIPLLFLMMFIDYRILARFSSIFYIISIFLLVLVLFTSAINGASSWFNIGSFSMQPAEFAKIAVILFLASVINKFRI